MIETLLLAAFAIAAAAGGLLMLIVRDPMRVALALIATMLSLAGIYALLGVHVIAVFQVLIYVGAVMVFMVYAIMLLDVRDRSYRERFSRWLVPGAIGGVLLAAVLAYRLWGAVAQPASGSLSETFAVQAFATVLLQEYWLHFELVSVLLVVAVLAALAILRVEQRNRG
jgi:NADH-quinone oxidoreductase subunit J